MAAPQRASGSTPGGLGTMGFGLPAAMGTPDRQAPHGRRPSSTSTATNQLPHDPATSWPPSPRYNIPVKVVILNNDFQGMIKQWQDLFYERRYSHVEMSEWPDFVKLAEATGCHGRAADGQDHAGRRPARRVRRRGPGRDRRPRHRARSPSYPMIAPGRGRPRTWWAEPMGEPRDQGAPLAGGPRGRVRRAHRPQARPLDPGREQAGRPDPDRRACSPAAGSTSTRSWSGRPTTRRCRGSR